MRADTKRNFMIGGAFFASLLLLLIYQAVKTENCDDSHHTVLVLVDYTDSIGIDALAALKDRVWKIIESAPDYSSVILRPILGVGVSGRDLDRSTNMTCRPEKPSRTSGFTGSAQEVREKWNRFKNDVCGNIDDDSFAGEATCGDERRRSSFFERTHPQSQSSPILEQIVDNTRRFLRVPDRPISWDLVIATDWKQYTQQLDLHTKPCMGSAQEMVARIPLLIPPDSNGKIFSALPPQDTRTGLPSRITSLFVLRAGMSNDEANCLERDFARFFLATNTNNIAASDLVFERLPRTAQ